MAVTIKSVTKNYSLEARLRAIQKRMHGPLMPMGGLRLWDASKWWWDSWANMIPLYRGPAEVVSVYQVALSKYALLIGSSEKFYLRDASYWDMIEAGLKSPNENVVDFHLCLYVLAFYPLSVFSYLSDSSIDLASYLPSSVLLKHANNLVQDLCLLVRFMKSFIQFVFNIPTLNGYFGKLEKYPQLLKRVKLLSTPLSICFIKASKVH